MIVFVALLWAGLVLGVSFLATPVKFRAQSLTLPVALDVGQVTFHLLAKVERIAAAALTVSVLVDEPTEQGPVGWSSIAILAAILLTQTLYLLPNLDRRVRAVIAGTPMRPSPLHKTFAGLELAKVLALISIAVQAITP